MLLLLLLHVSISLSVANFLSRAKLFGCPWAFSSEEVAVPTATTTSTASSSTSTSSATSSRGGLALGTMSLVSSAFRGGASSRRSLLVSLVCASDLKTDCFHGGLVRLQAFFGNHICLLQGLSRESCAFFVEVLNGTTKMVPEARQVRVIFAL